MEVLNLCSRIAPNSKGVSPGSVDWDQDALLLDRPQEVFRPCPITLNPLESVLTGEWLMSTIAFLTA